MVDGRRLINRRFDRTPHGDTSVAGPRGVRCRRLDRPDAEPRRAVPHARALRCTTSLIVTPSAGHQLHWARRDVVPAGCARQTSGADFRTAHTSRACVRETACRVDEVLLAHGRRSNRPPCASSGFHDGAAQRALTWREFLCSGIPCAGRLPGVRFCSGRSHHDAVAGPQHTLQKMRPEPHTRYTRYARWQHASLWRGREASVSQPIQTRGPCALWLQTRRPTAPASASHVRRGHSRLTRAE